MIIIKSIELYAVIDLVIRLDMV